MKLTRTSAATALSALLLVGTLAGCSEDSGTDAPDDTSSESPSDDSSDDSAEEPSDDASE